MTRKRDLAKHIVDSALDLIARGGVKALTQPRLAKAAGLRASHLTYYFPRKADLFAAVLEAQHRRAEAAAERRPAASSHAAGELHPLLAPDRMRFFLATVLEVSDDSSVAETVREHVIAFEKGLAASYGRVEGDPGIRSFVDEVRGAGLRRLLEPGDIDLAAIAARHGLASEPASVTKRFDDARAYASDIERVVPGHVLLRSLAIATLRARVPTPGELLVSGCGPGEEVVAVAEALPGWRIDAVEPSPEMRRAAARLVAKKGLSRHVALHPAQPKGRTWQAGLSLLVSHLLAPAARRTYWNGLGSAIAAGGVLLAAEIERIDEPTLDIWCSWAMAAGCDAKRIATLASRLRGGFPTISAEESISVAQRAGFSEGRIIFQALGVSLRAWIRSPASAIRKATVPRPSSSHARRGRRSRAPGDD